MVLENKEHASDIQKSTDTHWMFTKDISPPIEILEISPPLTQKKFQVLIYLLEDFLVKHSQSLESGKDLPIQEVHCFSTLQELLKIKDLNLFSLKMLKGYSITTKGKLSPSSSIRFGHWGIELNGWCLTANFSEYPKEGKELSLSDILEKNPHKKYYLSKTAVKRIMKHQKASMV